MHSEYSFNHESIKGKLSINNPGDQDEYHNFNDLTICVAQIGRGGDCVKCEVPIYEKSNLTLEEAAAYFNIGINKLREMTDSQNCPFVLWVGTKRLIKRKKMDEYLEKAYSV